MSMLLAMNRYSMVQHGKCARYTIYTLGKLYTVLIRLEADAWLNATSGVRGKKNASMMSIHYEKQIILLT